MSNLDKVLPKLPQIYWKMVISFIVHRFQHLKTLFLYTETENNKYLIKNQTKQIKTAERMNKLFS